MWRNWCPVIVAPLPDAAAAAARAVSLRDGGRRQSETGSTGVVSEPRQ